MHIFLRNEIHHDVCGSLSNSIFFFYNILVLKERSLHPVDTYKRSFLFTILNSQVVLSASVDGKKVYEAQNDNPSSFSDVKIFAGDNFHDAVDASYSNLKWENLPADSTVDF